MWAGCSPSQLSPMDRSQERSQENGSGPQKRPKLTHPGVSFAFNRRLKPRSSRGHLCPTSTLEPHQGLIACQLSGVWGARRQGRDLVKVQASDDVGPVC